MVCSTDGYVSIIRFASGELGLIYSKPSIPTPTLQRIADGCAANPTSVSPEQGTFSPMMATTSIPLKQNREKMARPTVYLPPCEPGPSGIVNGPPLKKAKVLTEPVTQSESDNKSKRPATSTDAPIEEVDKLSLNTSNTSSADFSVAKKKQKKRIQPTLVAVAIDQNQCIR